MARTRMQHRTDIPGEAACGAAEALRRLKEAPKPLLSRLPPAPLSTPDTHLKEDDTVTYKMRRDPGKKRLPFFHLPYELRLQIYKYLIQPPGNEFRILHTGHGLAYVRCIYCFVQGEMDVGCWKTNSQVPSCYNWPVFAPALYYNSHAENHYGNVDEGNEDDWVHITQSKGFFYLLTVCKQMYQEIIALLYSDHIFTLQNYFTITDLSLAIPSSQFNAITKLQLKLPCPNRRLETAFDREMNKLIGGVSTTAERTFKIIAGMQNLKILRVEWRGYPGNHRRRVELFKPLCLVRQTESFVVSARWDWIPGEEELGPNVPFVVEEVKPGDWEENNGFRFSPDDPEGVDPEGFDEVAVMELEEEG